MVAYRVDGVYTDIAPGRWDITQSDLTVIGSDQSSGNNVVTIQNTTGSIQAYMIRTTSSGSVGSGTNYSIRATPNNPEVDAYDNVPAQRAYSDDIPGDAVSIQGTNIQIHNFHDQGDIDWRYRLDYIFDG